jgi:hypothetical protein
VRPSLTLAWLIILFVAPFPTIAHAQSNAARPGLMSDLLADVAGIESKIVGLANAMPPAAYRGRPGPGVRSSEEVLLHVAGDNYFMPALMGVPAPVETGIDGKDNKTVAPFEARQLTREQIVAELTKSFAFLKEAMSSTSDAALEMPPKNSVRYSISTSTWAS